MDISPPEGEQPKVPEGPAEWIAEFRRQVALVEMAATEWAVRWHEPEGRFIAALLGAMQTFSRLVVAAQAGLEATAAHARSSAETELAQVRELKRAVEAVNVQARNVQLLSIVEREHAVQRMIDETLPMFADRLKGALVIRESRWNRDKARRRYGLAGLVFIGVFAAGYGLCAWSQQDRLAAFDRCVAAPLQANGHTYCALDVAMAPPAASPGGS
jgi:hypothetical protein